MYLKRNPPSYIQSIVGAFTAFGISNLPKLLMLQLVTFYNQILNWSLKKISLLSMSRSGISVESWCSRIISLHSLCIHDTLIMH